ncbi:hypothetical protein PI124_g10924 [Phytophthora idaei]|nr:hypothetical protein PI125_g10511 [Phytophthora idaei]KAG3153737.1 hypothetical protein PI126_g9936 [Phytophthora idaei]KAG3244298.1 hypothetical protein PI124_g10924 [Phytophthora idaei]
MVSKQVYKRYLLHVIPAIKAKWLQEERFNPIYIQQDNATLHVSPNDEEIRAAGHADGWNIKLLFQPANSPDMNALDLGYFSSLQAHQYQEDCYNIDGLSSAVQKSYASLVPEKLDNIFLTLQKEIECVMLVGGGNEYKLPHIGKDKLPRV